MKFCSLSSGSNGNCQYIETDGARILIDAGLSGKRIEELLKTIEVDPASLDAIFVTHEHLDHSCGVGVMSRRYDIKVFANLNTWKAMEKTVKKIKHDNINVFENDKTFIYKDLIINPMRTFHDCVEGSGFIINKGNKKISLLTDTGWINTEMKEKMEGSQLFFIESNHDEEMLLNGSYSWALKQRILSNRGHLSNLNTADVMKDMIKKRREIVLLAHLSQDNNEPILASRTFRDFLNGNNIREGLDYILEVAKREEVSTIYKI